MGDTATANNPPVLTLGYGKRSVDELIRLLQAWSVDYLLDIRSKPYSKFKPEFNQDPLRERLRLSGIRYVFMGDSLGGRPKDISAYVDGKVDYSAVEELPAYKEGIERVKTAFGKGLRVALMCSEGKPEMCHRSKLIGRTLAEQEVPVVHLDENDEPKDQTAILLRLTGGNIPLFGEELSWTSRKAYLSENEAEEE